MKRLKIMKAYAVLWLFIYFIIASNIDTIKVFFFATLTFNLAVMTVLIIGIIVIMRSSINLVMLAGTFGILAYKKDNLVFYLQGIDKIMPANIAHMFHSRAEKGVLIFTSDESRTVVEWIDDKFSNQNRYINYFIGTSLMIGLLGTFSGLLVSIDEMGKIILSLTGDIDLGKVIRDFAGPLGGMATGFGSSLFGVVSAIILGLMGYILNKNQEALIEGVEDWLKGRIIDSGGSTASVPSAMDGSGGEQLPEQRSSFMDVFIDNISTLTKEMANISQTNDKLHSITIASVQQARDEHELSYELFENINSNLSNINQTLSTNATKHDKVVQNMSSKIDTVNDSLSKNAHKQDTTISLNRELKKVIDSLDNKNQESLNHLESLEKLSETAVQSQRDQSQSIEDMGSKLDVVNQHLTSNLHKQDQTIESQDKSRRTLESLEEKLEEELSYLQNIEKVSKTTSSDAKKQNNTLEDMLSKLDSVNAHLDENTQKQDSSIALQTDTRKFLHSIEEKSIDELRHLGSLEKLHETLIHDTQKQNESFEDISTQLTTVNETLAEYATKQDTAINIHTDSKEVLEQQKVILETLVGNNSDKLSEIRRISDEDANKIMNKQKDDNTPDDKKPSGFLSKMFS